jgi:hypothetical protein
MIKKSLSIIRKDRISYYFGWLTSIFLIKSLAFQKLLFPNREEIEKLKTISVIEVNQIESQPLHEG